MPPEPIGALELPHLAKNARPGRRATAPRRLRHHDARRRRELPAMSAARLQGRPGPRRHPSQTTADDPREWDPAGLLAGVPATARPTASAGAIANGSSPHVMLASGQRPRTPGSLSSHWTTNASASAAPGCGSRPGVPAFAASWSNLARSFGAERMLDCQNASAWHHRMTRSTSARRAAVALDEEADRVQPALRQRRAFRLRVALADQVGEELAEQGVLAVSARASACSWSLRRFRTTRIGSERAPARGSVRVQ